MSELPILPIFVGTDGAVATQHDGRFVTVNKPLDEFAAELPPDDVRVRLLGTRAAIPLIRRWGPPSLEGRITLEIASPSILGPLEGVSSKQIVHSLCQKPSVGGASIGFWRKVTEFDIQTAEIARAVEDGSPELGRLVQEHALWHPASFVIGLPPEIFGAWMAAVFDPRWFINPLKPDRSSLDTYLGLIPKIQARVYGAERVRHTGVYHRCAMTQLCWWRDDEPYYRSPQGMREPRNFVMRAVGSVPRGEPDYRAALMGSRVFASFIRQVWTSILAGPRIEPLFEPRCFFKTEAEIEAYKAFVETKEAGWNSGS